MNQPCQVCGDKTATYFGNGQWCGDCVPSRIIILQEMKPEKPEPFRDIWQRVAALEDENKELIKALYGLGDILRDMNKLERITGARLDALERIINERTADS